MSLQCTSNTFLEHVKSPNVPYLEITFLWLIIKIFLLLKFVGTKVFLQFKKMLTMTCHFFRPSVTHHISGTLHHLIIIFGTHLWNDYISWVFFIFLEFPFFGGKIARNGPKWQKILSVTLQISGTIHHMIDIYGTHV